MRCACGPPRRSGAAAPRYVAATRGFAASSRARALDRELARFEHVTVVRHLQRGARILLDQQNRHARRTQRRDDAEDLAHDQRRETQRRLVEQQQLRLAHQRPSHRQHLPLAAGQRARELVAPLGQARETLVDLGQRLLRRRGRRPARAGTRRARGCRRRSSRRTARGARARESARARRAARPTSDRRGFAKIVDVAARGQETHDRAEQRRLARAIRTDHADDHPWRHAERHVVHRLDLAVGDVQVADLEQCGQRASRSSYAARGMPSSTTGVALDLGRNAFRELLAEIHHHEPVGQAHHEIHVVLDQEHGHPFAFELAQQRGELLLLEKAQTCGRLVQQQQRRIGRERTRDLDDALAAEQRGFPPARASVPQGRRARPPAPPPPACAPPLRGRAAAPRGARRSGRGGRRRARRCRARSSAGRASRAGTCGRSRAARSRTARDPRSIRRGTRCRRR